MIITWYRTVFFNTELQMISQTYLAEEADKYILGIVCCSQGYSSNEFLVSFSVDEMDIREDDFEHVEQNATSNQPMIWSLVQRT